MLLSSIALLDRPALSVFGLGYVGCVSAACFSARGHRVIGIDVDEHKTSLLRDGRTPVVETGMAELVRDVVSSGVLEVGDDPSDAVARTDVTLVCVGTPSAPDGSLTTAYLRRVCEQIGVALGAKDGRHVVVFRSTMMPGTCEHELIPILEWESGKRAGHDFGVCVNPEYLREGSSISDFLAPAKTVVGQSDSRSGDVVLSLYQGLPGPRSLLTDDLDQVIEYAEICIVADRDPAVAAALDRVTERRLVIDLVRLPDSDRCRAGSDYVGIGW